MHINNAYDFGYQLTIDAIEKIASDTVIVTGRCFDGEHCFALPDKYKVGDRIFVFGFINHGDYDVVRHGYVKH